MGLVIVRRHQFVLAARKEFHEVAQKLARLSNPSVTLELEYGKITPEENPVVDVVERLQLGIAFDQKRIAERVKGSHEYGTSPLPRRPGDPVLHLSRRSFCKRQC